MSSAAAVRILKGNLRQGKPPEQGLGGENKSRSYITGFFGLGGHYKTISLKNTYGGKKKNFLIRRRKEPKEERKRHKGSRAQVKPFQAVR